MTVAMFSTEVLCGCPPTLCSKDISVGGKVPSLLTGYAVKVKSLVDCLERHCVSDRWLKSGPLSSDDSMLSVCSIEDIRSRGHSSTELALIQNRIVRVE